MARTKSEPKTIEEIIEYVFNNFSNEKRRKMELKFRFNKLLDKVICESGSGEVENP